MHAARWTISFLVVFLSIIFAGSLTARAEQSVTGGFDHAATGFPLTGGHAAANCESCHAAGRFTGTPRACAACHNGSAAVGKPLNHQPTTNACAACHSVTGWDQTRYDHRETKSVCTGCHNGSHAQGMPATHIVTDAPCESCHKNTITFAGTRFDHKNIGGTCASCHNGQTARGKSAIHVATVADCTTCHKGTTTFTGATFDHAGIKAGSCASCHNGTTATGKSSTHVATTAACDTCHKSTTSFLGATFVHPAGVTNCASCHNGTIAKGKSTTHITTTAACETCHTNTATFAGAIGMPSGHIPTNGAACSSCHKSAGVYTGAVINHTAVSSITCTTCHAGGFSNVKQKPADTTHSAANLAGKDCKDCHTTSTFTGATAGLPAGHIPTNNAACSNCHTTPGVFKPARMNHTVVAATACATCHRSSFSVAKQFSTTTHVPTSLTCNTCHTSTTSFLAAVVHKNTKITTGCATCHNGSFTAGGANGKSTTHVATTAACETCHTSTTTFQGATGGTLPAGHIPTNSASCSNCHTTPTVFKPAKMNHAVVAATACATCHRSSFAVAKQFSTTSHVPTSLTCNTCHTSTTSFLAAVVHKNTKITTGCATCHNGTFSASGANGKSAGHVATTAACETCHTSTTTFQGATGGTLPAGHIPTNNAACSSCHTTPGVFTTAKMNHAVVTATPCATCHRGGFTVAKQFPATSHVPTSLTCNSCHKSTTSFLAAVVHKNTTITTGCATCHNGTFSASGASGKSTKHVVTSSPCETCHKSTTTFLGATFVHPAVTSGCASCHNGSTAKGKSATTHIPTSLPCETCHKGTSSFLAATVHRNTSITTGCATCHTGSFTAAGANGKSANHVATASPCETCHKSTTTFAGATGGALPAGHIPTSGAACSSCHKVAGTFTNPTMNHTVVTALRCDGCHGGQYSFITRKPNGHPSTNGKDCNGSGCHSTRTFSK